MITLNIDKESEGVRLDRFLRKKLRNAKLSFVYKCIREGICTVNGKKQKQGYRLKKEDAIEIGIREEKYAELSAEKPAIAIRAKKTFDVLYEDDDMLIVNKPPFLASQPGTGVERNNLVTQVRTYLQHLTTKPTPANRLDRGTSGIVIIGKHRKAIMEFYKLFEDRNIEKYYLALVIGKLAKKGGTITSHLKRVTEKFQHKMLVRPQHEQDTVTAESSYRVLVQAEQYALVEVKIATGKMHQIRVQFAHLGHPLVGDSIYGNKETNGLFNKIIRRQFLHAYKIRFIHPFTKKMIDVEAPLPEDLKAILEKIEISLPQKK
ncbi:MAG: RluA family pseudouridine synthase [Nanoarchaeota archaeon]